MALIQSSLEIFYYYEIAWSCWKCNILIALFKIFALCQLLKDCCYAEHLPTGIIIFNISWIQFEWRSFANVGWSLEDTQQSSYSNAVVFGAVRRPAAFMLPGNYQKAKFLDLTPVTQNWGRAWLSAVNKSYKGSDEHWSLRTSTWLVNIYILCQQFFSCLFPGELV